MSVKSKEKNNEEISDGLDGDKESALVRNCNGQIRDARDHLLHLICEPLSLILVDDDDDDDSEDLCGPQTIQSDHSGF